MEKVTVDKAYFDALLRRADFHTAAQLLGSQDAANVSISRVEYDSLLRHSREYELLKNALFQGGITADTLDLLISGAQSSEQRHDSAAEINTPWTHDFNDSPEHTGVSPPNCTTFRPDMLQKSYSPGQNSGTAFQSALSNGASYRQRQSQHPQNRLRLPSFQRQVSFGMSSAPEEVAFDDEDDFNEGDNVMTEMGGCTAESERRTIYLHGLSERTTYRDLLSVIKGGKLLSVILRPERSALVTFVDGAAEFLSWARRNDIYVHTKRIEVKWADRQYRLNGHIAHKLAHGATRNIIVHSATDKGLTEQRIRDDMEHIHNLVIVDIVYRNGDAYVSMNSVHNALFARTCMMSRSTYKGCKIDFYRDECDVPMPVRTMPTPVAPVPVKKKQPLGGMNRFDMLHLDGTEGSSDEENRPPSDVGEGESEDQNVDFKNGVGVSLRFLDSESN